MKKRDLRIADQAQTDLLEIWLYIASDAPEADLDTRAVGDLP